MITREQWHALRQSEQDEYNKAKIDLGRIRKKNTLTAIVNTAIAAVSGLIAIRAFRANRYNEGLEQAMDVVHEDRKGNFARLEEDLFTEKGEPKE